MDIPKITSRSEWLAARQALLAKEKDATRARDALNAERRKMPMVEITKRYTFNGPHGTVTLAAMFKGHQQLLLYHFMFEPQWDAGCKSCSFLMDSVAGSVRHLAARDTAFAVVSLAPIEKIETFKARMGWDVPWFSSDGTDFNADFSVTIDLDAGLTEYNYTSARELLKAGKVWFPKGELPGLSAFLKQDGKIYHTYSTYQRGLDIFLNTYNLLDMTALGRNEADAPGQSWIRHHDSY